MRIERTAKTVIAGLMSVACLGIRRRLRPGLVQQQSQHRNRSGEH